MSGNYATKYLYRGEIACKYESERKKNLLLRLIWHNEFKYISRILAHLPNNTQILDVPCGTGRFIPLLLKFGFRVIGSDISLDMISQSLRTCSAYSFRKFLITDAEHLPFKDNSVDFIFSIRFFQHLPLTSKHQVLSEFSRVCRQGVIVSVPFFDKFTCIHNILFWLRKIFIGREVIQGYPITREEFEKLVFSVGLQLKYTKKVLFGFRRNICLLVKQEKV